MENRPPPRHKSPGRNFDRSRGKPPYRPAGGSSDGQMRGRGRPGNSSESRDHDRGRGQGRPPRRDGGPGRATDQRFGDRNRFDQRGPGNRATRPDIAHNRIEPEIKIVSDSQITDGKFRGKSLQNSVSPHSLPTARKVREIAFKVLARRVKAGRILDLGAAAGTIGIEAISRGAMLVTFVEKSARMCSFIRKNLTELGIKDGHGEVVEMEALPFLVRTARRRRMWDIVYLDMPDGAHHSAVVEYLGRGTTITQSGLLVIQHSSSASYPAQITKLSRWRTVDQGETILTIYERI